MIRRIAVVAAVGLIGASLVVAPSAAAQPPAPACGPDQAAVLDTYLAQKLTDPQTDQPWSAMPVDSNYDPCAELSTILLTIEKASPSSPVQALMFHRGTYMGPATWKAYAFTTLDKSRSNGDTVVLDYKSPGESSSVRYRWADGHVATLDPLPPV